jgi:hypothetical protein
MIVGMIELLTTRRAEGWAYVAEDPTLPLRVRARHRETILAQIELQEHRHLPPRPSFDNSWPPAFYIEFPAQLGSGTLNELTIEAARTGSDLWCALRSHAGVWRTLSQGAPEVALESDGKSQPRRDPLSEASRNVPFWSDAVRSTSREDVESRPVFVVGSFRSGTTAISLALQQATRYRGFPEGHVLDVACRLVNAISAHFEVKDAWTPSEFTAMFHLGRMPHARFRAETIELLRRLAAPYTTPFWCDKTPTPQMIASVPIISQAWPNGRFIFMKRRGLENLRSRLRKFPQANFLGQCREWALIMSEWRSVRGTIPNRFIEIDQRSLLFDAGSTAARVGQFLDLNAAEIEAFRGVLGRVRPEATGRPEDIVSDPSELGWSAEQIEIFQRVCGAEMDAYGYTYDEEYGS